jgi:hypothetical protein
MMIKLERNRLGVARTMHGTNEKFIQNFNWKTLKEVYLDIDEMQCEGGV